MIFTGKISFISPKTEGTSQAGNAWKKVEIVVTESGTNYPNELLATAMNDRLEQFAGIKVGDEVTVEYDLRVREYNGRHYMNAMLYKISKATPVENAKMPADKAVEYMTAATQSAPKPVPPQSAPVYNDLPF